MSVDYLRRALCFDRVKRLPTYEEPYRRLNCCIFSSLIQLKKKGDAAEIFAHADRKSTISQLVRQTSILGVFSTRLGIALFRIVRPAPACMQRADGCSRRH